MLVLALGFDQHLAVGTSLGALLPPVGILGAYEYYRRGHLNVTYALLLGLGLLIGAYIGARVCSQTARVDPASHLGVFLPLTSIRMLYQ